MPQLNQRLSNLRIKMMAFEVYEEVILPRPNLGRPRLYLRQINGVSFERRKYIMKRADLVPDRKHYRCLVLLRRLCLSPAYYKEPRHVMRRILDRAIEHFKIVSIGGENVCYTGGAFIL